MSAVRARWIGRGPIVAAMIVLSFTGAACDSGGSVEHGSAAPGECLSYSNAGYHMLRHVVEDASGQSFAGALRSRIVFEADGDIWTVDPDGSNLTRVIATPTWEVFPS